MNNSNLIILKNEFISTLVLLGIVISLIVTLLFSSSSVLEAWRMFFNHLLNTEVNIESISDLLTLTTLSFLIILGPILIVSIFGRLGRLRFGAREANQGYQFLSKSIYLFLETVLISLIFLSYIYLNFDHILLVQNLTLTKIFSFLWKTMVEIIFITLIFKASIISLFLFRREPKSH
jgi:hypothetical protein